MGSRRERRGVTFLTLSGKLLSEIHCGLLVNNLPHIFLAFKKCFSYIDSEFYYLF